MQSLHSQTINFGHFSYSYSILNDTYKDEVSRDFIFSKCLKYLNNQYKLPKSASILTGCAN